MEIVLEWRGVVHGVSDHWLKLIYARWKWVGQMWVNYYPGWMVDDLGPVCDRKLDLQVSKDKCTSFSFILLWLLFISNIIIIGYEKKKILCWKSSKPPYDITHSDDPIDRPRKFILTPYRTSSFLTHGKEWFVWDYRSRDRCYNSRYHWNERRTLLHEQSKLDKIRCSRTPNERHELKRFKNQYIVIYVSTKIPGRMIIVPVSIYIYTLS